MESTCLWNSLPFACRSVVINLGCNDDLVIWFSAVIPWKRKSRKMALNCLCISYGGSLSPSRSFWLFSFSSSFSTCSLTTEVTVWHSLLFFSEAVVQSFQACAWLDVWTYLAAECCRKQVQFCMCQSWQVLPARLLVLRLPGERLVVFSHCFLRREQRKKEL